MTSPMKIPGCILRARCLWLPALVCGGLLVWSAPSGLIAKKVVGLLVLPPGLVWLGLMSLAGWPGLGRGHRALAVLVLAVYKELMAARNWRRVGVCSSAWHLRRVERICRSEGVDMVPVPADFLSASLPWNPIYAIPQARGFQIVQKALWEFLGAAAGG